MPTNEILPFISINVYIEREYLEKVAKNILEGVGKLEKEEQIGFSQNFRKYISVLGGAVKRLGKYEATIRLHRDVTVDIEFEVVAEA